MSNIISYTLIHSKCKKPMQVEGKIGYKIGICKVCNKRILLDSIDNPIIQNGLLII